MKHRASAAVLLVLISTAPAMAQWQSSDPAPLGAPVSDYAADEAKAKQQVSQIVNQPVNPVRRTSEAAVYSPGWFDAGARTPDWNTVDIRKSQQFIYEKSTYATSTLNPNEMFESDELEFNAMTKIFYADRSLPKHRLTEDEMERVTAPGPEGPGFPSQTAKAV